MKVFVYYPTYNDKHKDILTNFWRGVPGATFKKAEKFIRGEGDIGVVFGWWKNAYKATMCKKPIIDYYRSLGDRRLIVIESAFQERGAYFQIGWDGFAGHADFNTHNESIDRWQAMKTIEKPWRDRKDGPCVVVGQLPRDTQVQDVDHLQWCRWAVREAQRVHKHVIFRPHPKVDDPGIYRIDKNLINTNPLQNILDIAKCVVTWNSTTGVDSVVNGVPTIAMDDGAMAWPMASHSFDEPLIYPDRTDWLATIGYSQWTKQEMKQGKPWLHLAG